MIELKPNNERAIRLGERQLRGYIQQLELETGESWIGHVETYEP